MAVLEWLFGPAGDVIPLPSPDLGVVSTVDRFGGTHVSISGGRTVDTFGFRGRNEFTLPYLEAPEYERLEALFTRQVPGTLYLVDPLRRNVLSRESASSRPAGSSGSGLSASAGAIQWVQVSDGPNPTTRRVAEWSSYTANAVLFFDKGRQLPLLEGQDLTSSAYIRPTTDIVVRWNVELYNSGTGVGTVAGADTTAPANVWTRVGGTISAATIAANGANEADAALQYVSGGTTLQFASAQAEYGSTATDPALGGGSLRVEFDKFDVTAPWYPYRTVNMTLLEV